jgi:hypothetical protein
MLGNATRSSWIYICIYTYTLAACALSAHVAVGDVLDEGGCGGMVGGLASRLARARACPVLAARQGGGVPENFKGSFSLDVLELKSLR